MNNSNLIEINPTAETAKRLRRKLEAWSVATENWIAATLELCAELWAARQMHASNQAFGVWLAENELDQIGKDDRAALVNMGCHLDLSRGALEETDRRSPQHIWRDLIQPRLSSSGDEDGAIRTTPVKTEKNDRSPVKSSEAASESGPRETGSDLRDMSPKSSSGLLPAKAAVPSKSPFRKWPRADEVTAIYLDGDTRTCIGKAINGKGKAGKEIWGLILQTLSAGLIQPTPITLEKATLRVLFPGAGRSYSGAFDLTRAKDRAQIRDEILPAAIACKDAILERPGDLESIIKGYLAKKDETRRTEAAAARLEKQLGELPPGEQEILMYGERLWPRPGNELYSYKELRSGIWCFRDLDRWLEASRDPSIASRALIMRYIVGHFHSFSRHELDVERSKIENLCGVINKLSRLMERSPEGECRFPPSPKREDEW